MIFFHMSVPTIPIKGHKYGWGHSVLQISFLVNSANGSGFKTIAITNALVTE